MPRKKLPKNFVTDTPERDNPVLELVTPRLSEDKWDEVQSRLTSMLELSISTRSQLDEDLQTYNRLYEGVVPEEKMWPWVNAANLHVPLTSEMVDGIHSRLAKASLGVSPLVLVKGKDTFSSQLAPKIERYYDAFVKKTAVDDVVSEAIFLALRDGVGLIKVGWEERKRKVKVRSYEPILDADGQTPVIDPLTEKPALREEVKVIELTEFDDARAVTVELKDFYLLPTHAYTIDRFGSGAAKGAAHRLWVRFDEIQRRGNAGIYKKDAVEMLRDNAAQDRDTEDDVTIQGQVPVQTNYQELDKEFELFDIYMSWDLDGDGYDEECVFTVASKFDVMLRAEVFPYWHQKRPFIAITPWPRPRRFYGFSIAQRLEPLQRELNTIHNQRIDTVTLYLSPPLLVTKNAVVRGDLSQGWGPGVRMEVENKDDVSLMPMPDINPSAWTEETMIRQYAERLIGMYDINTPRGTGARRTRAEIGAIQGESMIRFDYMMKRIQRSITDLFDMIHQLKIQYMPEEEEFETIIGPEGPALEKMSRQEMTVANLEFRANGDLPVADRERAREEAYFLYNMLSQSPLVASNFMRLHALTKAVLDAWDRRDTDVIIGTREEAGQLQQQMQEQQAAAAQAEAAGGAGGQPTRSRRPSR